MKTKERLNLKCRTDVPVGTRFGILTVLGEGERLRLPSGQVNRTLLCKCDCGTEKQIRLCHLSKGKIRSCGCAIGEFHGCKPLNLYRIWHSMRQRCSKDYNERKHRYKDRGITVCEEWENSFIAFRDWCLSNGWKKGVQMDRKDNNLGYSPDNCRFVDNIINVNNREVTVMVNYKGKFQSLRLLLREIGRLNDCDTIRSRMVRGWTGDEAIDTPVKNGNYWRGPRK